MSEETWKSQGGSTHYYRIGPVIMSVVFVGDNLKNIIEPALQHNRLYEVPEKITATIYTLDAAASGVTAPPVEWPFPVDTRDHFQRIHWKPDEGMALASDETRGIWNLFNMLDLKGTYWVRNGDDLPSWEAGAPLRIFIHWLARLENVQLVHAASLFLDGRGVLLAGAGGSGKSTTTAAALVSGWGTAGDDFVLIEGNDQAIGYCIYDTVKLSGMALEAIPEIAGQAVNPERSADDKARIHLHKLYNSQLILKMPVSAIFSIKIGHAKSTEINPVSKAEVMKALAPSTLFMLRTGMQEAFMHVSALVNHLPCYHIQLGNNPHEVINKLGQFIKKTL